MGEFEIYICFYHSNIRKVYKYIMEENPQHIIGISGKRILHVEEQFSIQLDSTGRGWKKIFLIIGNQPGAFMEDLIWNYLHTCDYKTE
jgi:hypothetical protein